MTVKNGKLGNSFIYPQKHQVNNDIVIKVILWEL